jgi:hypothetical protein
VQFEAERDDEPELKLEKQGTCSKPKPKPKFEASGANWFWDDEMTWLSVSGGRYVAA